MAEFRASITLYFMTDDIHHANQIIDFYLAGMPNRQAPDDYVGHAIVEFKHPTLGWTPIETDDEDHDGEGYLAQSG